MPYIDTTPAAFPHKLDELNLQVRLGELLEDYGWQVAANFKKVAVTASILNPGNSGINDETSFGIAVAEHFIYKNAEDKMFGLALVGEWSDRIGTTPKDPRSTPHSEYTAWATNEFRKYRAVHTLYFYMLESLEGLTKNGEDIFFFFTGDLTQAVLDIEVEGAEWVQLQGTSYNYNLTEVHPERMQSPIIAAGLRSDWLDVFYDPNYNSSVSYTNWWYDSVISAKGYVDDKSLFLILQADNVPAPEGNLVPSIPLYFGRIDPVDPGDIAYAMFAGSVPPGDDQNEVQTYDYDNPSLRMSTIMPIIKKYPKYPSNGVDTVMVSRAKFGARYQAHYLSWNAPPNLMPPLRTNGTGATAKDYPRAWNGAENPMYKYQFNPSRYSKKVHTSKVYVVHPEEGVRGSLINCLALAPISFSANKLRVRKEACPDPIYELYHYALVEGVSPLTKRPGTQFHPAGIGIYDVDVDENNDPISTP